jgi:hypothetical protein
MSVEIMKQALEALKYHMEQTRPINMTQNAIHALRQAIEEAEKQEPVGEIIESSFFDKKNRLTHFYEAQPPVGTKLYTAPPRKEWVGLTDEELSKIYNDLYTQYTRDDVNIADFILIARAIEAKLKEKNNG